MRWGVVACVGLAGFAAILKFDDTVGFFDLKADQNAAQSYTARSYPPAPWTAGSPTVLEDARLWMPESATYRVVKGPLFDINKHSGYGRYFLLGSMLPRRQTESTSAPWVFCYGCGPDTLGPGIEVLSDSGDGVVFGRVRQ